jgi:hypothetical protein
VLNLHHAAKSRDAASFSQFSKDFQTIMSFISITPYEFLITGDVNIHMDVDESANFNAFNSSHFLASLI